MTKDASAQPDSQKRLDAFLEVCRSGKPIYIMTHDHPDPDAITSAAGIQYLIKHALNLKSRIVARGAIPDPHHRRISIHCPGREIIPYRMTLRRQLFSITILCARKPRKACSLMCGLHLAPAPQWLLNISRRQR